MVSEDLIVRNEVMNDGSSIHLYFSKMFEEYVAYGYSAFIAIQNCMMGNAEQLKEGYSEELQMPIVKVDDKQLALISDKCLKMDDSSDDKEYLQLQSLTPFNERKYSEWAERLREVAEPLLL